MLCVIFGSAAGILIERNVLLRVKSSSTYFQLEFFHEKVELIIKRYLKGCQILDVHKNSIICYRSTDGDSLLSLLAGQYSFPLSDALGSIGFSPAEVDSILALPKSYFGEILIEHVGTGINIRNSDARTPLSHAAICGDAKLVAVLVRQHDVLIDAQDIHGKSPLMHAVEGGHEQAARILVKAGANVNFTADVDTILIQAAKLNDSGTMLHLLIEAGAFVNEISSEGETALIVATEKGNDQSAHMLIMAGADVHHFNQEGNTALMKAAQLGYESLVQLLLLNGADINVADRCGQTALIKASMYGHKSIVRQLLTAGADINMTYSTGFPTVPQLSNLLRDRDAAVRKLTLDVIATLSEHGEFLPSIKIVLLKWIRYTS